MKDDRHLIGLQKSTHPFEEIIPKQVTVVIKINCKLSKHGLSTCHFCNLLRDKPQPLSPSSIKPCFILLIEVGFPGHHEHQFKCHVPEKATLTTQSHDMEESNPKYCNY